MTAQYSGLENVFFAKDRKSALARIKGLAKENQIYKNKFVRLNKKQVPHSLGWKTWEIIRKQKR